MLVFLQGSLTDDMIGLFGVTFTWSLSLHSETCHSLTSALFDIYSFTGSPNRENYKWSAKFFLSTADHKSNYKLPLPFLLSILKCILKCMLGNEGYPTIIHVWLFLNSLSRHQSALLQGRCSRACWGNDRVGKSVRTCTFVLIKSVDL